VSPSFAEPEAEEGELDLTDKHPIAIVEDGAAEVQHIERRPGTVLVKNFNHHHKTYYAEIPVERIAKSYLPISQFSNTKVIKVAHAFAMFEMEAEFPVRLYDEASVSPKPSLELGGFVFSFNYAAAPGVKYSPTAGLLPQWVSGFRSTHNLRSPRDLWVYARVNDKKIQRPSTELHEIDYSPEENKRFAEALIRNGAAANTSQAYNTACWNCSNIVFNAMDSVRKHSGGLVRGCGYYLTFPLAASPARSDLALSARGLRRGSMPIAQHPLFSEFVK